MRRTVICVAAALAVVVIGVRLNSGISKSVPESTVSNATMTPALTIWEIHNLAHIKFLADEQFEDQSLVFTEAPR
jgi:hypothetical protein